MTRSMRVNTAQAATTGTSSSSGSHTGISSVVTRLALLVREHYVLEVPAHAIAARLIARSADPGDVLTTVDELAASDPAHAADLLREALQDVHRDGHLRVRHRPEGALDDDADPATTEAMFARECLTNAGGLRAVRRLEDGTGVLEIAPYLSPAALAESYVRAAFALLSGVPRLVVDVRDCRGADPRTVALLCGHLLGPDAVHLQDLHTRDGTVEELWTVPAARDLAVGADVPVAVLTSSATFSGGEEVAYDLQAFGRATVVGEQTGGGAHPRRAFRLTDTLEAHIPVASSVNTMTGGNWEHVGVTPDVPCPAEDALATALRRWLPVS